MTISLRVTLLAFFISIALFSTRETGMAAKADSKIVVRIETATVKKKGDRIVIQVTGMGRTAAAIRGGGRLLPRGQKHEPNKDGLLEYDLYYVPPPNYSGDKLKTVKASLVESNVPPGVKGVRIYAEFNERNAMLPEQKVRGRKPKEGFVATEEEQAARKKEPAVTEERPKPKKEEVVSRTEVQEKKSSRSWNPFHRKAKPVPTPQPTPVVARSKKAEPTPKKQEVSLRKTELPPAPEEPKKKRGWNPFHRHVAPQTQVVVEEWQKPEAPRKKQEVPRVAAPKIEESPVARETPAPKIKKKSRGWTLNPFHRKPAEPEVNAVAPPPKKPEPIRQEATAKKKEPTPEATPKKEEVSPKKEEKKKKSKWRALNPLHWNNPFKRDESTDPAPER